MKRTPKEVATGLKTLTDHELRLCALEDKVFGELPEPVAPPAPVVAAEEAVEEPVKKSRLDRLNPKPQQPKKGKIEEE